MDEGHCELQMATDAGCEIKTLMEQKFLPRQGFEPLTYQLIVQHANHYTTEHPNITGYKLTYIPLYIDFLNLT